MIVRLTWFSLGFFLGAFVALVIIGVTLFGMRIAPEPPTVPTSIAGASLPMRGWATWDPGQGQGHAAAGPALRAALGGDPAFRGTVVTVGKGNTTVTVVLDDWCACGDRHGDPTIIDLDPADFLTLYPAGEVADPLHDGGIEERGAEREP